MTSRSDQIHKRAGNVITSLFKRYLTEEEKRQIEDEKEFSSVDYFSQIENDVIGLERQLLELQYCLGLDLIHSDEEQRQLGFPSKSIKSILLCGPQNCGKSWLITRVCVLCAQWTVNIVKLDLRVQLQTDNDMVDTIKRLFETSKRSEKALILLSGIDELFVKKETVTAALWIKILQVRIAIHEEIDKLNTELPVKVVFESRKMPQQLPKTWLQTTSHVIELKMTKQNASRILKSMTEIHRAKLGPDLNFDILAAKFMQRCQPLCAKDLKLIWVNALTKAHDKNLHLTEADFLESVSKVMQARRQKIARERKRKSRNSQTYSAAKRSAEKGIQRRKRHRSERTDSEIKKSAEKDIQRKKRHRSGRTDSEIKKSAEKDIQRKKRHRSERTDSEIKKSVERNIQRKKRHRSGRTDSEIKKSVERNIQRKKRHRSGRTDSEIKKSAEKDIQRKKRLRESLSTPERRKENMESYRKSAQYRQLKRRVRYKSNPLPDRLRSKRYLNLAENRRAAKKFRMSQYIRQRYATDEEFRAKQKERVKTNKATQQRIKHSKCTLAGRNAIMGRMKRYQRYMSKAKEKYGDESLCDPMLEAKLSEMENVKQPKGHKARRDKASLWRQNIERSMYLDKIRALSKKELTDVMSQKLAAETKESLNDVLKLKREQIGHLCVLLRRLKKHHDLAEEAIKNISDSQGKEDCLSALYGKLNYHVYTQEAYGNERAKDQYISLDKLKEEIQSDFPLNQEEDYVCPTVKQEYNSDNSFHGVGAECLIEKGNAVNSDYKESDSECFQMLATFEREKYSALSTDLDDILHKVHHTEKSFARQPLTMQSLVKLEKRLILFNEQCMKALLYLDNIIYSGDNKAEQLLVRNKRKTLVDSVEKLLKDHDDLNTKLKQMMDISGEDKNNESDFSDDDIVVTTEPVQDVVEEQISTEKTDDCSSTAEVKVDESVEATFFTHAKRCDCSLPSRWATRFHEALSTLVDLDLPITKIQDQILAFEHCPGCSIYSYPECRFNATGDCQDKLKFLRLMAPHFTGLRTLLRLFYEIRRSNMWLLELDSTLAYGHFHDIERQLLLRPLVPNVSDNMETVTKRVIETQQEAEDKYGGLMDLFKMAKKDVPTHECQVCHVMHYMREIKTIAESRKSPRKTKSTKMDKPTKKGKSKKFSVEELLSDETSVLRQLMASDNLNFPLNVCKTQSIYSCYDAIMKNEMPKLSSLNKMNVNPVPPELSCLNEFEKVLIQRARCFMTIVKLKPFRYRGPSNNLVKAKKGTAVHFNLPAAETVDYVGGYFADPNKQQTLPSTEFVEILVDSVPTNKKVIWRSVVDMKKVVAALEHLKNSGNPLYKNIKIDCSSFDTDEEWDDENDEKELVGPLLKHLDQMESKNNCDHYTVKGLGQEYAKADDIDQFLEKFQFKRAEGEPIKEYVEKNLEALCFPCLIPDGVGHFYDTRKFPLKFQQYAGSRLKNADPRFRKDLTYLFFLMHHKEMRMIDQGIFATFRTGRAPNMTAEQLMSKLQNKDKLLEANLNNLMNAFRGSEQFWNRKASDLAAMDEKFGPATFFLTLSCKEYEWEELRCYLEKLDPEFEGMGFDLGYLCAINPVAVSIFFEHRFRKFMDCVLLDKNGPLGEVIHYAWRLEYQARGTPHIHMKLWIKDAPIIGQDTKEEIVAFIDKYITCRLPNPVKEPELATLVKANQMHKCCKSCLKGVGGVKGPKKCRYGFPRSVQVETTISRTIDKSVKSHVKGKKVKKMYDLARTEKEVNINDYNVAILLMWEANMDIQYVGEKSMILNHYITMYVAKADRSATADLWTTLCDQFNQRTVTSNLKAFGMQILKQREMGANEAVDQILGHPLMRMSESVIYLSARPKNERTRKFLTPDQLKNLEENSTELYCDNLIDVYYPNRPKELENCCLYEVASKFSVHKGKMEAKFNPKTKEQTVFPFQISKGEGDTLEDAYFQVRKECVVKTPVFGVNGDQAEKHFYQMVLLFKPFRNEELDLCEGSESYQEAFEKWYESLGDEEDAKLNEFRTCRERTKKAVEGAVKLKEEAEAEAEAEAELTKNEDNDDDNNEQPSLDPTEFATKVVDADKVDEQIEKLNSDQRRVFDKVIAVIQHQDQHKNGECDCDEKFFDALRSFVTGVGGTGKSFLIQALRDYIVHHAAKENADGVDKGYVVVLAPTGVAAYNVNGQTIHRCFKLPVQKGKTAQPHCFSLDYTSFKEIRNILMFAKLIIIDEISMVSNAMLAMIHCRLDEIFGGSAEGKSFGNKNLLVFGDLLQLKPPKSPHCFMQLSTNQLAILGGITLGYKLWDEFEYDELVENMRQKNDKDGFIVLLQHLRVGSLTEVDITKLRGRLIQIKGYSRPARITSAVKYFYENLIDKNALCVLATNEQVKHFNDEMINFCKIETVDIECEEPNIKSTDGKKPKRPNTSAMQKKVSETAGLETVLTIGVGARVMLRRNIDVSSGLVNGSMGTVTKINFVRKNKVSSIEVLFDGKLKPTEIKRVTGEYEITQKIFVIRKQFPLHVSYAITIHKCQGVSVDHIMVDLGSTIFEKGQAYVALSRCRSLEGLHIIELNTNRLLCDIDAWNEYERLRKMNDLPKMPEANVLIGGGSWSNKPPPAAKRSAETDIGPKPKKKRKTGLKRKRENEDASQLPTAKKRCLNKTDPPSSQPLFLKFKNATGENHCFVNSAIQALLALDFEWNHYKENNLVCSKMAYYHGQMASGSQNVINCGPFFRQNVGTFTQSAKYHDCNMHDSQEFILDMIEHCLPDDFTKLFRFQEVIARTCMSCGRKTEPRDPTTQVTSLQLGRPPTGEYNLSQLVTSEQVIADYKCEGKECMKHRETGACMEERSLKFPEQSKYLLVSLPIFIDGEGHRSKMELKTPFKHSSICFGDVANTKWKTVAAIRFRGPNAYSGHYDCIRVVNNQLYCIGDTDIQQRGKFFDFKDIRLLVLEKL